LTDDAKDFGPSFATPGGRRISQAQPEKSGSS
jgi:hypothetical protein